MAGYPPFNGNNQRELFRLIKKGRYEFHQQYWRGISDDAKDLVSKLLVVDPKNRLDATAALQSPWMSKGSRSLANRDLGQSLVMFRKFNAKRKMKQAVLAVSWKFCLILFESIFILVLVLSIVSILLHEHEHASHFYFSGNRNGQNVSLCGDGC